MELLRQLELRHEAFMSSRFCGTVHVLDGRLGKEELVSQAVAKIKDIQIDQDAGSRVLYPRVGGFSGST